MKEETEQTGLTCVTCPSPPRPLILEAEEIEYFFARCRVSSWVHESFGVLLHFWGESWLGLILLLTGYSSVFSLDDGHLRTTPTRRVTQYGLIF